ncbi:site-specific integrase [bacterium]|nr:site-specific integrase [bacterium]
MATIVKRETKSGISYKIQVKYKDKGSGEVVVKSTTWKPSDGMGLRQQAKEVKAFADAYETQMRQAIDAGAQTAKCDQLFKTFAEEWLNKIKEEFSLNYYVKSKLAVNLADKYIGGYKLRELNPSIIQNFYNKIDKLERTITKVIPRPVEIRKAMEKSGIGYMKLRYEKNISSFAISQTLEGNPISIQNAKLIAKALNEDVNILYDIQVKKEKYAYESIHKIKRTVRAILSVAKKQRLIEENYAKADFIDFPKRPPNEIKCMNAEQARKFYATLKDFPDIRSKTAMMITLLTGIRRGELCGLEWKDIDWKNSEIKIQRSITTIGGYGVICKDPKTETSKRTLSISEEMIEQLKEYKSWQDKEKAKWGDRWVDIDRLFTMLNGDRINPSTIHNWLNAVTDAAELPRVTLHSLRHTNITLSILAGVPLITVSGRAGHARTSTTTDVYSHFLKSGDRDAVKKLNTLLG